MGPSVRSRSGEEYVSKSDEKTLEFLYGNAFGRVLLKAANKPFTAKVVGRYMNSRFSKRRIEKFVEENGIDMSLYEEREYKSYNDFFTRRLKPENLRVCSDKDALVAPCDSKLTAYTISEDSVFYIKNAPYSAAEFLKDPALASEFNGGYMLVFRLTVDNYHRYCYFDSGTKGENIHIKGVLHTVKPVSLERYDYYRQNCREYTVMQTENFGKAIQAEIGAMLVGKISNLSGACAFVRGEEKGMFEFGGSTVVVMLRKGVAVLDEDIVRNSAEGVETAVHIGERIGSAVRAEADDV